MEYYIINRMYAGAFLRNNLGHEVINLFSSDDGSHYVYICDDGTIDHKYNDRVKAVLLTRMTETIHKQEILGIAIDLTQISRKEKYASKAKNLARQQQITEEYLVNHKIEYGGVSISDIFAKNKWGSNREYDGFHAITFKAEKILIPKKKIYIVDKEEYSSENCFELKETNLRGQKLRRYIGSLDEPADYTTITSLIARHDLWDDKKTPEKIIFSSTKNKIYEDAYFNYLDIIGRQDDENVFSNLIRYFLDNDGELLSSFCREVLKIADFSSKEYLIEREKNANGSRMDLYVEDRNHTIVIENKIKSEINGTNERHNFNGKLIQSQLGEYYKYVEEIKNGRQSHYFILMPDYHKIDISKYENSKHYTKIYYSDIYEFFKKHTVKNPKEKGYYEDFIKALNRHAEDYYDDQYAEMKKRFINRLEECRRNSK